MIYCPPATAVAGAMYLWENDDPSLCAGIYLSSSHLMPSAVRRAGSR